jgi:hypothetical protein
MMPYKKLVRHCILLAPFLVPLVFFFAVDQSMPGYAVAAQVVAITVWWLFVLLVVLVYKAAGQAFLPRSYWFSIFPSIAVVYVVTHGVGGWLRSSNELMVALVVGIACCVVSFRQSVTADLREDALEFLIQMLKEIGVRPRDPHSHLDILVLHMCVFLILVVYGAVPALSS